MVSPADGPILREISEQRERWIAAINAGDADGFVSVVTDDAVWLPAGRPAIAGRSRIRDWLAGPFAEFSYDYSVSDVRVRLAGEWAVERATFRTRIVGGGGAGGATHQGTYTMLWRRTERGWMVERYVDQTESA